MTIKIAPLDSSADEIKKMLAENGITSIDDLVDAIKQVAATDKQSGGVGRITPMASWVIKIWRLDSAI